MGVAHIQLCVCLINIDQLIPRLPGMLCKQIFLCMLCEEKQSNTRESCHYYAVAETRCGRQLSLELRPSGQVEFLDAPKKLEDRNSLAKVDKRDKSQRGSNIKFG
eukprot:6216767-Amphidinium_carterae.1